MRLQTLVALALVVVSLVGIWYSQTTAVNVVAAAADEVRPHLDAAVAHGDVGEAVQLLYRSFNTVAAAVAQANAMSAAFTVMLVVALAVLARRAW